MGRLHGRAVGGALLMLGLLAGEGEGQQGCEFLAGTGDYVVQFGITYIQSPRLRCQDGLRIVADSAVHYESSAFYQLFGRVLFENAEVRLNSGEAQYYQQAGRITAQQAVRLLRKADSTVVTGENLEYLQINQFRTQEQLTVTGGRPHAVLHPRAEGAEPPDSAALPYEVDADRIFVLGNQQFQAAGTVEIHRGDLDAFANEVDYNGTSGQLVLNGDARLETETYDLSGGMVLLEMPGDRIEQVVARERGVLQGQDLELRAPLIQLYMTDGVLDRLVARQQEGGALIRPAASAEPVVGIRGALEAREREAVPEEHPTRPFAVAEGFTITADSLDVDAPGEVIETIYAIGRARAVSSARDSLNQEDTPEVARRDWIAGDTVVATLVPVGDTLAPSPAGERREYTVDRLVARANASSLYRLPPTDTASAPPATPEPTEAADTAAVLADSVPLADTAALVGPPRMAVHYVRGDSITILLAEGAVQSMQVAGQTAGVHLEPRTVRGGAPGPEAPAAEPGSVPPGPAASEPPPTPGLSAPGGRPPPGADPRPPGGRP